MRKKNQIKNLIQKRFRRGQGALEYLMTYGWAVLIVSIVIILVWQWGFLQPKIEPAAYGFWGVKPVDWKLSSDGVFKVVLTNEVGGNISLDGGTIKMWGQNYNFPCTGTIESGGYKTCFSNVTSVRSGTQYSLELSISYNYIDDDGVATPHMSSGKIVGYYEEG